jgi:hypothetical protein
MARTRFGFSAATSQVKSGQDDSNIKAIIQGLQQAGVLISAGRVVNVIYEPPLPIMDSTSIGDIEYVDIIESPSDVSQTPNNQPLKIAKPLFSNIKNYPLINEIVLLIKQPDKGIMSTTTSKSIYYLNIINLWNHPHHNAIPYNEGNLTATQVKNLDQVQLGSPRIVTNQPTEIYFGKTFQERSNINPLLPFEGDVIHEGRWGQSLRFGSTVKNRPNDWSSTGTNGDPITIIRNGQGEIRDNGWEHVTENINSDKGSIYFTSTQKIPLIASSTLYASYSSNPPTNPNEYNGNQILISSGRLVFNTSQDHLLLSSAKTISLNAVEGINIDTLKNITVQSNKIYLGSKSANQPLVLGNRLENLLNKLLNNLINFSNVCETTIAPDGHLAPLNYAASQLAETLKSLKATVPNIKSNYNYTK